MNAVVGGSPPGRGKEWVRGEGIRARCSGWVLACLLICTLASAQSPQNAGGAAPVAPPLGDSNLDPAAASPVAYFRQLLDMPPAEAAQSLAQKLEPKRKALQAKLDEYRKLTIEEREARLRLVELWYYLQPLISLAPAERPAKLAAVPVASRPFVEERLKWWDLVPQEHRKQFLENELAIQYFVRLDSSTPAQREQLAGKSADEWRALEEKLQQWSARPPEERVKMYQHFQDFFELPEKERDRTLHALSDEERQKLQRSLEALERLPAHQRATCIESFRKFSSLSKEEREQFLHNVERWQEMSPRDRQNWVNLINLLPQSGPGQAPPRLPPGMGQTTPTKPPPQLPGQGR